MISRPKFCLHDSLLPIFDHRSDSELRPEFLGLLVELLVLVQLRLLRCRFGDWYRPIHHCLFLGDLLVTDQSPPAISGLLTHRSAGLVAGFTARTKPAHRDIIIKFRLVELTSSSACLFLASAIDLSIRTNDTRTVALFIHSCDALHGLARRTHHHALCLGEG